MVYDLVGAIDTVMVDAPGEILYLEDFVHALSPDKRYLYNFNKYDHTLEKVDLEELRFDLVAESAVPQLANPMGYFARGGDIWIPANINDEMAFIRVSLNKQVLDSLQGSL